MEACYDIVTSRQVLLVLVLTGLAQHAACEELLNKSDIYLSICDLHIIIWWQRGTEDPCLYKGGCYDIVTFRQVSLVLV